MKMLELCSTRTQNKIRSDYHVVFKAQDAQINKQIKILYGLQEPSTYIRLHTTNVIVSRSIYIDVYLNFNILVHFVYLIMCE